MIKKHPAVAPPMCWQPRHINKEAILRINNYITGDDDDDEDDEAEGGTGKRAAEDDDDDDDEVISTMQWNP